MYGSTCPQFPGPRRGPRGKMDPLFLGVFNVVPGGVLRFFSRVSIRRVIKKSYKYNKHCEEKYHLE
jgi:hypothetical protein